MQKRSPYLNMILSALCLAIAFLLPNFTGNIPQIGMMLLPMHLPVLICGMITTPFWGGAVGVSVVLLRSVLIGMPPLLPMGVAMAVELGVYGVVAGLLVHKLGYKLKGIYLSLISAMVVGRIAFGIVFFLLSVQSATPLTPASFLAMAVTSGIPGIIAQLVFIPPIVLAVRRGRMSDITWL